MSRFQGLLWVKLTENHSHVFPACLPPPSAPHGILNRQQRYRHTVHISHSAESIRLSFIANGSKGPHSSYRHSTKDHYNIHLLLIHEADLCVPVLASCTDVLLTLWEHANKLCTDTPILRDSRDTSVTKDAQADGRTLGNECAVGTRPSVNHNMRTHPQFMSIRQTSNASRMRKHI